MDEIAWGQNPGEKGRGPQSQPQAPPTPGGRGPGRADGSPAAERGAGQQPQHQGRRSLSRAAQLVLPSPDHPGHGATSLRSLDGPFPPPERAEAPHGQRRRRGARAGCWLRGARGRSRGDLHMAHDSSWGEGSEDHCSRPHRLGLGLSANKTPGTGVAGTGRGALRALGTGDRCHSLSLPQGSPKKGCREGVEWGKGVRDKCQARSLPYSGWLWVALESHGIARDTCVHSWDLGLRIVTPTRSQAPCWPSPA